MLQCFFPFDTLVKETLRSLKKCNSESKNYARRFLHLHTRFFSLERPHFYASCSKRFRAKYNLYSVKTIINYLYWKTSSRNSIHEKYKPYRHWTSPSGQNCQKTVWRSAFLFIRHSKYKNILQQTAFSVILPTGRHPPQKCHLFGQIF